MQKVNKKRRRLTINHAGKPQLKTPSFFKAIRNKWQVKRP